MTTDDSLYSYVECMCLVLNITLDSVPTAVNVCVKLQQCFGTELPADTQIVD